MLLAAEDELFCKKGQTTHKPIYKIILCFGQLFDLVLSQMCRLSVVCLSVTHVL